jgi:hypothetical protein
MCEMTHIKLHTSTLMFFQNLFQYKSITKILFNLHVLHVKDNQFANLNNMHIQDKQSFKKKTPSKKLK